MQKTSDFLKFMLFFLHGQGRRGGLSQCRH